MPKDQSKVHLPRVRRKGGKNDSGVETVQLFQAKPFAIFNSSPESLLELRLAGISP